MSARVGSASNPTSPKGMATPAKTKAGALAVPVLLKVAMAPSASPTIKSRSPSPLTSPKASVERPPTSARPKGLVTGAAKAGARAVPVFLKKIEFPSSSPTKASRSPSPSMSTKAGVESSPTSRRPQGSAGSRRPAFAPARARRAPGRAAPRPARGGPAPRRCAERCAGRVHGCGAGARARCAPPARARGRCRVGPLVRGEGSLGRHHDGTEVLGSSL